MAKYLITKINGDDKFKIFLLGHNISIGTIFTLDNAPKSSGLAIITVFHKKLSFRKSDFEKIEFKIEE